MTPGRRRSGPDRPDAGQAGREGASPRGSEDADERGGRAQPRHDREADRGDARSFAEQMSDRDGVVPLGPGRRVRQPTPHRSAKPVASGARPADPLQYPDPEERLVARRSFVRRAVMRDLCAGRVRPERRIDLHGHDRRSAERALGEAIAQAARDGLRCLLVVVGRGRRSADGTPVLRERLPDWLASPVLARHVAATAPAVAHDGGRGAVYVLLR